MSVRVGPCRDGRVYLGIGLAVAAASLQCHRGGGKDGCGMDPVGAGPGGGGGVILLVLLCLVWLLPMATVLAFASHNGGALTVTCFAVALPAAKLGVVAAAVAVAATSLGAVAAAVAVAAASLGAGTAPLHFAEGIVSDAML